MALISKKVIIVNIYVYIFEENEEKNSSVSLPDDVTYRYMNSHR